MRQSYTILSWWPKSKSERTGTKIRKVWNKGILFHKAEGHASPEKKRLPRKDPQEKSEKYINQEILSSSQATHSHDPSNVKFSDRLGQTHGCNGCRTFTIERNVGWQSFCASQILQVASKNRIYEFGRVNSSGCQIWSALKASRGADPVNRHSQAQGFKPCVIFFNTLSMLFFDFFGGFSRARFQWEIGK